MITRIFNRPFSKNPLFSIPLIMLFCFNGVSYAKEAENANPPAKETKGEMKSFRIGGGISGEYITLSAQVKQDFTAHTPTHFNQSDHMKRNFQVAPFIEFGSYIGNNFYLGLITSWHYSNTKDKSRFSFRGNYSLATEFNLKSYLASLIKMGFKLQDNMMLYGVVGPSYAKWTHKTKQYLNSNIVDSFDVNKSSLGVAFGGGAEFSMSQNTALSIDYIYTRYRSTKACQVISFRDGGGPLRSKEVSKTIQPSYGVLSLKLSYFF